jgi:hypothetical protein
VEPTADLDTVRAAAERTADELHQIVGRDDLHHRIELRVARGTGKPTRRVL